MAGKSQRPRLTLLALVALGLALGDAATRLGSEIWIRVTAGDGPTSYGSAFAQEEPDDDDDDDDDAGSDGVGDDDPGNDGAGDDPAGDDVGGDDPGGDDGAGDDPGDDDGPGGDDDGPGGDDDGPGGDDDGPGGDDDGPGGDDDDALVADADDDASPPDTVPDGVELDDEGQWVKAGEILAIESDPTSLEFARELGFQVIERYRLTALGDSIVELRVPRGSTAREALELIQRADPNTPYDFNHFYAPSQASPPVAPRQGPRGDVSRSGGPRVGFIDTGVDASHPTLRGASIEQRNFAERNSATAHGTAVASLLISNGAARDRLLSAAVVERSNLRGVELASADALVRAFDWLVQNQAPVVNVSLAGPPNTLLEEAVRRAQARGMIIVAAVGNDGPAAPPAYPAAYAGVVGVTAVDANGGVYRRAGRGGHVDFAARGVNVEVAAPGGQTASVSGTSYAAPAVAAALAREHTRLDPESAERAVGSLLRRVRDAGEAGRDPVYGAGVLPEGGQ